MKNTVELKTTKILIVSSRDWNPDLRVSQSSASRKELSELNICPRN